jgi:hypothetical protein
MLTDYIDLKCCRKCSEGSQREIYEHPSAPDVLIKVVKATKRGERGVRLSRSFGFLRKYRRFGAYMTYRREIEEYIEQARKLEAGEVFDLPVPKIFGLALTSSGLGLVVEKISTSSGGLAPTLAELVMRGQFQQWHVALIDHFFHVCRQNHIVLMDVNPANFVVADRDGRSAVVCVDGTGEKSCLKLYAMSRRLNTIKLRFARKKLMGKIHRLQLALQQRQKDHPETAMALSDRA